MHYTYVLGIVASTDFEENIFWKESTVTRNSFTHHTTKLTYTSNCSILAVGTGIKS